MSSAVWTFGCGRELSLDRPRVMAILNVTPDSFSDGGRLCTLEAVVEAARQAEREGADVLDVGGESTRPGARRVPAGEQIRRVVPAIEAIRRAGVSVPISVDTTLSEVAEAAGQAGAEIVNDVAAGGEDERMFSVAAARGMGMVLMHRLRPPGEDAYSDRYESPPQYRDVVEDVRAYLSGRVAAAREAGIAASSILVDPGLGFGKSVDQNLKLISGTGRFVGLGVGVLSALSRKSFVGRVSLGRDSDPSERLEGSIGLSLVHLVFGARVFRVHDVGAQVRALRAGWAVLQAGGVNESE